MSRAGVLSIDTLEDGEWIDLLVMSPRDAIEVKYTAGPPLAIILGSGLAVVGIRWWSLRRRSGSDELPRS